jgi:hypothetical protein
MADGVFMKRIVLFVILAFSTTGLTFAQSLNENDQPPVPETAFQADAAAQAPAAVPSQSPPIPEPAAKPARSPVLVKPAQKWAVVQAPQVVRPAQASQRVAKSQNRVTEQTWQTQPSQQIIQTTQQTQQTLKPSGRLASGQNSQTSYQFGNSPASRDTVYIIPGAPKRVINGVLGVNRGMITLTDYKGVSWYVMGLDRYIGFIEGLDLGKEVELEGYAPAAPGSSQERLFQATKVIVGDMDYDLAPIPETSSAQPRREQAQPKVLEHKHIPSQWAPNYESTWMQTLDLGSIWKEDTKPRHYRGRD